MYASAYHQLHVLNESSGQTNTHPTIHLFTHLLVYTHITTYPSIHFHIKNAKDKDRNATITTEYHPLTEIPAHTHTTNKNHPHRKTYVKYSHTHFRLSTETLFHPHPNTHTHGDPHTPT